MLFIRFSEPQEMFNFVMEQIVNDMIRMKILFRQKISNFAAETKTKL